ncbi:MAG: T9SS type A sorting domain-containing protein [Cytophagales bacterium]|nr:T9SS type A sorting domain-containing protein [Cytophagales bacterium]
MLKKVLYTLGLIAGLGAYTANAQCVPDETLTTAGVYPKTFTSVCVNTPVEQTLQIVIPANVKLPGFPDIAVDSFEVVSVNNLPAGVDYVCATTNCKVVITNQNDVAHTCLTLIGTPTEAYDDEIEVTVKTYSSVGAITQPEKVAFKVNAADSEACVIDNVVESVEAETVNIYPNPSQGTSTIDLNIADNSEVQVTVFNAIGNEVANVFEGTTSSTNLEVSDLSQGIYFVQVIVNGEAYLEKLIVE